MQEGSLLEILQRLMPRRREAAIFFASLPILTYIGGRLLRGISPKACGRFLTVPIHLTVLPGICMSLVVAYLMLFAGENLLTKYDAILLFGPILCMAATLTAAWKVQPFDEIPGFDRLSGLMLTAGAAFLIAYLLSRLTFRIFFFTPMVSLVVLFLVLFGLLKLGTAKILGQR